MATYVAFMRAKLHFSRKMPSSLFMSHYFYNLTSIHQRLTQNLSSALLQMTNETNLVGITFKIRVKQLQNKEWLHMSPLVNWPYNTPRSKDDWLPSLLDNLNRLHIKLNVPTDTLDLITGVSTRSWT
jgi:hypothetical protein